MKRPVFKPLFLLFLLLPAVCLLLLMRPAGRGKETGMKTGYFSVSVSSEYNTRLDLLQGKDTLLTGNIMAGAWREIEYSGNLKDECLQMVFSDLREGDSIRISAVQVSFNGHLKSYHAEALQKCRSSRLKTHCSGGPLSAVRCGGSEAASLFIDVPHEAEKDTSAQLLYYILIFSSLLAFALILLIRPGAGYFIGSLLLALTALAILNAVHEAAPGKLEIMDPQATPRGEIFFSRVPVFSPDHQLPYGDSASHVIVPYNFSLYPSLRVDPAGDSGTRISPVFQIRSGIFRFTSDPQTELKEGMITLNDLVYRNGNWIIMGPDPYFKMSGSRFREQTAHLAAWSGSVVWMAGMGLFMAVLLLYPLFRKLFRKKEDLPFRAVHLLYLLLPLAYYFIDYVSEPSAKQDSGSVFYFSGRTEKPADICLYSGSDSICRWHSAGQAYQYFSHKGDWDTDKTLRLKVISSDPADSLKLLSVNLYHEGRVDGFGIPAHVTRTPAGEQHLIFAAQEQEEPGKERCFELCMVLLFILCFAALLLLRPSPAALAGSCISAAIMIFVLSWPGKDLQDQLRVTTAEPVGGIQVYYHDNPGFTDTKVIGSVPDTTFFKTNMDLESNCFLRIDINSKAGDTIRAEAEIRTGCIRTAWDFSEVAGGNVILNELEAVHGGLIVKGIDPFVVLCTAEDMQRIGVHGLLKKHVYIGLGLLIFLILLLITSKRKSTDARLWLGLNFAALSASFLVLHLFSSEGLVLSAEMRFTNPRPNAGMTEPDTLIRQTEAYINDQVPGRSRMIMMNNLLEYSVFRELVNNPSVHFGKDGWMFYVGELCRENYENRYPLKEEELRKMKEVLEARRDWLQERGIRFYLFFPEMSYVIYEDKVGPRMWRYNLPSKLDQLLAYLEKESDLEVIGIHDPLMEAKDDGIMDLYYKHNSHWTHYGGYIAYREMIRHIQRDVPQTGPPMPPGEIEWVDFAVYKPDLFIVTALDQFYTTREFQPTNAGLKAHARTTYPQYPELSSREPIYTFHNSASDGPKVLLYGDSYGGFLLFYLTWNFSQTTYIYTPRFYPGVILQEKPDIVIQEMADYMIYKILEENPPLPAMPDSAGVNE